MGIVSAESGPLMLQPGQLKRKRPEMASEEVVARKIKGSRWRSVANMRTIPKRNVIS